jgi:hypothetical protein
VQDERIDHVGYALVKGPTGPSRPTAPIPGSASLAFGASHVLAAAGVAFYPF